VRTWIIPVALLLARVSHAGVADPSMSYEDPCLIACPAGDSVFVMVVRNSAGFPWLYDPVRLVFCDCPRFHLTPGDQDYFRAASGCEISKYPWSDGTDGSVFFAVAGGGVCGDSVGVYSAGIPFPPRTIASPDQDGDLLVTSSDLAIIQTKLGTTDRTADFDCDGVVTAADSAIAFAHLGHGVVATAVPPPVRSGGFCFARSPWPNPASRTVRFAVNLAYPSDLDVTVRDLFGRSVVRLWHGELPAGEHPFVWNGTTHTGERARTGHYLVVVRANESSIASLVTLLR